MKKEVNCIENQGKNFKILSNDNFLLIFLKCYVLLNQELIVIETNQFCVQKEWGR